MALAAVGFSFTIPLSSYFLSTNVSPGLQSWKELAPTRARYSFVALIPFEVWGSDRAVFEISRWAPVLCAVLFFVFFGFTQDAKEHYHLAYSSLAKRLGSASARFKSGGGVTLPLDTRVPHEVKLEGGITDPGYGRPKSPASTTASSLVYEIP
jgi:pheromone a factor receptor